MIGNRWDEATEFPNQMAGRGVSQALASGTESVVLGKVYKASSSPFNQLLTTIQPHSQIIVAIRALTMLFNSVLLLNGLALAVALPYASDQTIEARQQADWTWDEGAAPDYTIHVSCNSTERAQLQRALNESTTLTQHAKNHIMRYGNSSDIYVKYFGNSSTTAEPAGWFDKLISGDKNGVIFRCDDVDNKCYQDGKFLSMAWLSR